MTCSTFLRAALGTFALLFIQMTAAHAAVRTYVASYGSDGNACTSVLAPCQNLSAGITKVDPGGVVTVLDTVSTGTAHIDKPLSIVAVGGNQMQFLSATAPFGEDLPDAAIHVSVGANEDVVLDGLAFKGFGSGIRAIRFNSGRRLHIRNCLISGYPGGIGIDVQTTTNSRVLISDCKISETRDAIFVRPIGPSDIEVLVDRVTLDGNSRAGIRASKANAVVRVNASTITNNGIGLDPMNNGQIISFGNNALAGNETNGAPSDTIPLR
jgi:hypothetical protein